MNTARLLPLLLCVGLAAAPATSNAQVSSVEVTALRINYAEHPIGIGDPHPRFSWQLRSERHGVMQQAYQVRVFREQSSPIWDSGQRDSGNSVHVQYEGPALESG
ncbi:MAG TPA: hypothetical protein VF190_16285, partial [Rhodothermales bacterium]